MQNTSTSKTFRPAQSLSEEEMNRIEFERDWENALSIEDFRQLMKEEIRKRYANYKQQK